MRLDLFWPWATNNYELRRITKIWTEPGLCWIWADLSAKWPCETDQSNLIDSNSMLNTSRLKILDTSHITDTALYISTHRFCHHPYKLETRNWFSISMEIDFLLSIYCTGYSMAYPAISITWQKTALEYYLDLHPTYIKFFYNILDLSIYK